jgi:hypothetical protein
MEFSVDDSHWPVDIIPAPITVSNVAVLNNVVTLTSSSYDLRSFVTTGDYIALSGFATATFLNGQILQVINSTVSTVRAIIDNADYPSASDSGSVGKQESPNPIPLLSVVTIDKPHGTAIGIEVDPQSRTPVNMPANELIGVYCGPSFSPNTGAPNQALGVYGVDVEDVSGSLRESAALLVETQNDTDPHYYGLKVEATGTARDSAAVAAYSTGEVSVLSMFSVKASETIGACAHTVGAGLWDATSGGDLTSDLSAVYTIKIIANGPTADVWAWSAFGEPVPTAGSNSFIPMVAGQAQPLERGVTVTWAAATGHTIGDEGTITVTVNKCTVSAGVGSPEGVLTAIPGSIYMNSSGGAGTSLYVKQTGTGNTGWVGK